MSLKKPVYMPMISMSPIDLLLKVFSDPGNAMLVVVVRVAVGGGYSHHHAPVSVEVITQSHIVPLGVDILFSHVEGWRRS